MCGVKLSDKVACIHLKVRIRGYCGCIAT